MKKIVALLTALLLLAGSGLAEAPATFAELTGLDQAQQRLDNGEHFVRAYYTGGEGWGINEFETTDPEEILRLWNALGQIETVGETDIFVTDWYPTIAFYYEDGTAFSVCFDGTNLDLGKAGMYTLKNDGDFWDETAGLLEKYRGEPVEIEDRD